MFMRWLPRDQLALPFNCFTGSLRREGWLAVYGFDTKFSDGAYPRHGENIAGVMPSENSTLPPASPNRTSLVHRGFHADRTAVTTVKNASRCPASLSEPRTVPVPGKKRTTLLMPSGKRRYGSMLPTASQWCCEVRLASSFSRGKSILCVPGARNVKLFRL